MWALGLVYLFCDSNYYSCSSCFALRSPGFPALNARFSLTHLPHSVSLILTEPPDLQSLSPLPPCWCLLPAAHGPHCDKTFGHLASIPSVLVTLTTPLLDIFPSAWFYALTYWFTKDYSTSATPSLALHPQTHIAPHDCLWRPVSEECLSPLVNTGSLRSCSGITTSRKLILVSLDAVGDDFLVFP